MDAQRPRAETLKELLAEIKNGYTLRAPVLIRVQDAPGEGHEGTVERTNHEESEAYFRTRPVAAQIGAWVSQQSTPIASRAELERLQREITERFADGPVPLPEYWGGVRVVPHAIEFWQGRPSRLHDRILYTRQPEGTWTRQRLAP